MTDITYFVSGYIADHYFIYTADAESVIQSSSELAATANVIHGLTAQLQATSTIMVVPGATSRLTIVPVAYTSTAGRSTFGAFYIDAGPQVTA